jgi:hypothetical protein
MATAKPKKTKKVSGRKKQNLDNPAHMRQEVINELGALRSLFHDISARHQANVEAIMVACINQLSGEDLPEAATKKTDLSCMLEKITSLKLKPQKGRLKDLKRVEAAADEVSKILGQR